MTAPFGFLAPGSSSAISTLMQGLLAQGQQSPMQPPPGPGGPPGMPPVAPPIPSAPPNGGLLSMAPPAGPMPVVNAPAPPSMKDRIHDWLRSKLGGNDAPGGYEGLLSPDEIKGAKPGIMASLSALGAGGESPSEQYANRLDRIVKMKMLTGQVAEAKASKDAQQKILAQRATIASKFPEAPNETPQQTVHRLLKVFDAYTRGGDVEMAGKVGNLLNSMGGVLEGKSTTPKSPIELRLGDHVELLDPETRKPIGSYKINPSPRDPNAPDTASQLRDQRMFAREQQLADDYNKDTKTYRELNQKLRGAVSELPRAMAGDGAAQTNMIYTFVSAMDPASAVREGEMALVQAAAPLRARAATMLNKYLESGQSAAVPKDMLRAMGELMARRQKMTKDYVDERSSYYTKRAKTWGVDTPDLFPSLDGMPDAATAPPSTNSVKAKIGGIR